MALKYVYKDFMCKCIHVTRLYKSPNDITPDPDKLLNNGTMFVSDCYVEIGSLKLYQITFKVNNDDIIPCGYWCSNKVLSVFEIESESDNIQSDNSNDVLLIKDGKIIIYPTINSTEPITNDLKPGYKVFTDRKTIIVNETNSLKETRYRITSIKNELDEDLDCGLIGTWILFDYSVIKNNTTIIMSNSVPSVELVAGIEHEDDENQNYSASLSVDAPDSADDSSIVSGDGINLGDVNRLNINSKALYDLYGFNYTYSTNTSLMSVPLGRMLFVHGMPFQYTYLTDRRGNSTALYGATTQQQTKVTNGDVDLYGRTFAKEIAANMPIVVIAPGEPEYMTSVKDSLFGYKGTSNSAKQAWLPFWQDLSSDQEASQLEKLLTEDGTYNYYSMKIDTAEYYLYVNALCQTSARFMGLDKVKYRGDYCTKIDWGKYNSAADQDYSTFEEVMGLSGGVSFAFDPASSITDTITNSTGESQFSSMLNGISAKARELDFVAGQAGVDLGIVNTNDYNAAVPQTGWTKAGSVISDFTTFLSNTSKGMNVRFPEIWQDSENQRSYDLEMHFISPYATAFCKWRYVLVPFFHIFCLVAPRSDTNTTVYQRPFLIRAFSKGYFNVENGIIESLTWRRFGDGDMISADGVPTQIDVSISFKDMYHTLAMSKTGNGLDAFKYVNVFFNNTGLMDMLGTLSGVNMNRISLSERLSLYFNSTTTAFGSMGSNFMRHYSDRVRNITQKYFVGL